MEEDGVKATERDQGENPSSRWEEKIPALPTSPGVYIFKNKEGKVLYVGKAKNLRARVRSYGKDSGDGRRHVQFLRRGTWDLEYVITDNEKEALILENNLIKKYRPRYNLRLRDDKTYFHVRLTTSEKFPRLLLARRPKKGGRDELFGPYSSSASVKSTIKTLQEIFPLRRCQGRFRLRDRACLNHQIGACLGPCTGGVDEEEYRAMVDQVTRFLKGRKPELVKELKEKMLEAAEAEKFELAARLRDRVQAIELTLERQKVDSTRPVNRDVIGFYREGDRVALHLLGYRDGILLISESSNFSRLSLPDDEVLGSFLSQLYPDRAEPPDEILAPFTPADSAVIVESLSEARGKKVSFRVPLRGEGKELVEMASANAGESLRRSSDRSEDGQRAIEELQARLRLSRSPHWIECVDISNLAGEHAVGSVVKFLEGYPDKSGYRRYRIKDVKGVNDYDMMREVLTRRFGRALREGSPLPDLLVVDGGKGQLNVARAVMEELGVNSVDLAGLAKDGEIGDPLSEELKKKGERVFVPGAKEPVHLKRATEAMFLLQRIRDEAHAFAVSYHKLLRSRQFKRSVLEDVPGVGGKKAAALIKKFGGISGIRNASVDEIAGTPGVSKKDAEKIKSHLD